ncbi:hypothetical protein [Ferrimonas balearica]|uniref:hypothetical protein n=1 Tax=Ferrimonas balearica TaxID=44012 RepID=UPI001C997AFC|nr:hypothetical protein [Ferrimonas balearica]MBY5993108.1 hypothetical protein [Ferrimonas balearica]
MSMVNPAPRRLGWLTVVLPLLTTHLCYLVSLWEGWIPPCNPYWSDCVSISSTGRNGSAYLLFKSGMLPTCLLLFLFWRHTLRWLAALAAPRHRAWLVLALLASLALATYTLTLGHGTGYFPVIRRTGVALFILGTFLLQVSVGDALYGSDRLAERGQRLLAMSTLILAIALLTLVLDLWLGPGYDRWENAFEWWLFLLLNLHLLGILRAWQVDPGEPSDKVRV